MTGYPKLLSVRHDSKTPRGEKLGYLTGIVYLSPAKEGVRKDICPWSTPGCRKGCIHFAGMGAVPSVKKARAKRKRKFFDDRKGFLDQLFREVANLEKLARAERLIPAVRLNGTSDLPWEILHPMLFRYFPNVAYYDYTKSFGRMIEHLSGDLGVSGKWPANYKLIFSMSEENHKECFRILNAKGNVAMVFNAGNPRLKLGLPSSWLGYRVIDGDENDAWFARIKPGEILGLRAKWPATHDKTGFVIDYR